MSTRQETRLLRTRKCGTISRSLEWLTSSRGHNNKNLNYRQQRHQHRDGIYLPQAHHSSILPNQVGEVHPAAATCIQRVRCAKRKAVLVLSNWAEPARARQSRFNNSLLQMRCRCLRSGLRAQGRSSERLAVEARAATSERRR